MKYFVVICCVLASVVAKEKKISLEDIERDNLKPPKISRGLPQGIPEGSPTTYGFVPTKTVTDYARQQPKYVQYVPPQQYTPPAQQYALPSQQYQPTQQYQTPQQYYYQPQQPAQQSNLYQQYANLPYITDNSISQQQYYTPQYVYLQQYTAPSTAVQSVVDPKGGIQYVMYVPSYTPKAAQTQNYESVIYDQQSYVLPETQYVPQQQVTPSIKYAPEPEAPVFTQPEQQTQVYKEPKSLLDSYVPSVLQVQFYKQQQAQAQANAIQQTLKEVSSPIPGKADLVKGGYKPTQTQYASAESINNYSYEVANTQQKYN